MISRDTRVLTDGLIRGIYPITLGAEDAEVDKMRKEGMPLLIEKFKTNLARRFAAKQQQAILDVALDLKKVEAMPVHEFVDMMTV